MFSLIIIQQNNVAPIKKTIFLVNTLVQTFLTKYCESELSDALSLETRHKQNIRKPLMTTGIPHRSQYGEIRRLYTVNTVHWE